MVMQASVSTVTDHKSPQGGVGGCHPAGGSGRSCATGARAKWSDDQALITHLKLHSEKVKHQLFGSKSDRSRRLLDPIELRLEELEATACQDEAVAEIATGKFADAPGFERRRPLRQAFYEHLPCERCVIAAPCAFPAWGGTRLSRIGEDVTETLAVIPRQWKVIQMLREKVACQDCEKISLPPFHVVTRSWAGPGLLAMLLFEKYG